MVDANIVLRFLLADKPEQSARCRDLFQRVRDGETHVFMAEVAFCDVVWTLKSFYRWTNAQIYSFAMTLLGMDNLVMTRKPTLLLAISLLVDHNIDFSDALIAAEMIESGVDKIFSFDRDFDRIQSIERIEP